MKRNGGKKSVKKPGKKTKFEERFINILAIVLLGGILVVIAYMMTQMRGQHNNENDQYHSSLPSQTDTLIHSKICMVDDSYQGNYTILPVTLSGKTYYGCDVKATQALSSKQHVRFAIDPVTKRKVDKASAIIGLHPRRDGKVLYFESKETFTRYLNALSKQ